MTLERLRQEWDAAKVKHLKASKEFRALEKEFYLRFLEELKDSNDISDGKNLDLPEFTARDDLKLLRLNDVEKEAYDLGWRGKSFYFQNK